MPLQKHKIYQTLFILFIISLAGGSYMLKTNLLGIDFYAFRYVLLLGISILFFFKDLKLFTNKFSKLVFYFFLFWIGYASLSLVWCLDLKRGVYEIIYLIIGLLTYLFLFSLADFFKSDFKKLLFENWVYALIPNIIMGFWEIKTGNHLYGNYTESLKLLDGMHDNQFVPVTVFDNPNNLAIFLSVSLLFLSYQIIKSKKLILSTVLLVATNYLMYQTSSRIGIIYSLIVLVGLIFMLIKTNYIKNWQSIFKLIIVLLFFFNSIMLITPHVRIHNSELSANEQRIQKVKNEYGTNSYDSSSVNIRKNLILNGIQFFKESYGIGIGAGSFEAKIIKGENKYPTFGNPNPHNYFIRILAEYGILVLGGILILFLTLFFKLSKLFIRYKNLIEISFIVFLMMCFVLMSNANSSFLPLPMNWVLYSLIFISFDLLNKSYEEGI